MKITSRLVLERKINKQEIICKKYVRHIMMKWVGGRMRNKNQYIYIYYIYYIVHSGPMILWRAGNIELNDFTLWPGFLATYLYNLLYIFAVITFVEYVMTILISRNNISPYITIHFVVLMFISSFKSITLYCSVFDTI